MAGRHAVRPIQDEAEKDNTPSVDDLLTAFENILRKMEIFKALFLVPLGSIDFAKVFASLGSQVSAPKTFGFSKRNIHFAGACAAGARQRLPYECRHEKRLCRTTMLG